MASFFTQLCRSFITTLFYLWTVLQALLSLRSPGPFPFHESAIIVPYPPDIDLERGVPQRARTNEGGITARHPPRSALPAPSREASNESIQENAQRQDNLKHAPAFSVSFGLELQIEGSIMSASGKRESPLAAARSHAEYTSADQVPSIEVVPIEETFIAPDLSCNPFLDISPSPSASGTDDKRLEDPEAVLFTLPDATSTPPRIRRGGKGHRRAALATITNISHLEALKDLAGSAPASSDSLNLLSSPSASDDPALSTPVTQRMRSPSLRRKPAYDDLHSGSPTRSTHSKRPASVIWFSSSSIGTPLKTVDPLNIVKRNSPGNAGPANELAFPASESMNTDEVRSVVRDAFVHLHTDNSEEDEGAAARELINRESVFTCDKVPTAGQFKEGTAAMTIMDDSDDDEEYGEELVDQSSRSPPPPYAFTNPDLRTVDVKVEVPPTLDTYGLKPDGCGKMIPACSVPPSASTELSYLQGDTPTSSADSSLNDIITSFEHLMATMSPKFQASMVDIPSPAIAVFSEKAKVERRKGMEPSEKSSLHPGSCGYDELLEEYATQWSEVLLLDTY
ncbi:hypothetical protein Hypma_006301 [Hypsizygus marmoreus]|uniref:Uncharacterized protein n=1 Tax=Hypsizygus marmoreus TaxID=39966 RepID=A0A369JWA0_HYPMA|nr:hypothetical protein Hypma_006301 [Hypsizygus marmoreus]